MVRSQRHAPRTALVLASLVACSPGAPSDTESGSETGTGDPNETDTGDPTGTPTPIELCPAVAPPPPFAVIDEQVTRLRAGACGHLLYVRADELVLASPDLAQREILAGLPELGQFAPTGHLVAWRDESGVVLRDLREGGASQVEGAIDEYGFAASKDPAIGARLWACRGDEIGVVDLGGGFRALDSAPRCEDLRIRAAAAAPILVYGPINDALHALDLDTGEVAALAVEYVPYDGSSGGQIRGDEFAVSQDGRLVVHDRVWIERPPDIDSEIPHHVRSTLLDARTGAALREQERVGLLEAATPGLPVVLRGSGAPALVAADLAITPLPGGLTPWTLLRDHARAVVHDGAGLGILDLAGGQFTPWIAGVAESGAAALDRAESTLAARVDTDGCVADPQTGDCVLTISELRVRHPEGASTLARFTHGVGALAVSDHGTVLAAFGLLTEPPPSEATTRGVFVFDLAGALLSQWTSEDGAGVEVRDLRSTGDHFVGVFVRDGAVQLHSVEAATGVGASLAEGLSYDLQLEVADARAALRDGVSHRLWAGALP